MTRRDSAQSALPGIGGQRPRPAVARVRRGVDVQLRSQRHMGRLEAVDEGLVALARTLADAIDSEVTAPDGSRYTVGALAGRLFPVLLELRGDRHDGPDDGQLDAELLALVASVRDAARPDPSDDR